MATLQLSYYCMPLNNDLVQRKVHRTRYCSSKKGYILQLYKCKTVADDFSKL